MNVLYHTHLNEYRVRIQLILGLRLGAHSGENIQERGGEGERRLLFEIMTSTH